MHLGTGALYPYSQPTALNDVVSGANGICTPAPSYWCTAESGYDGPAGLGTPNSSSAFSGGPVPVVPTLTASTSATKGVALAWNAPPANCSAITQFVLYSGTSAGLESSYVSVVCNTSTCAYNDRSTQSRHTYYYQVAAVNAFGTGPRSNEAQAREIEACRPLARIGDVRPASLRCWSRLRRSRCAFCSWFRSMALHPRERTVLLYVRTRTALRARSVPRGST